MKNKKLVGQLVDLYWELDDTITILANTYHLDPEGVTLLEDLQNEVDVTLTNASKRWAKGNRTRKELHTADE